jgi:hypothetical protein
MQALPAAAARTRVFLPGVALPPAICAIAAPAGLKSAHRLCFPRFASPGHNVLGLQLLGEVHAYRDGKQLELPPSRKTRALLAYLVATGRPHRRERLCTLFWEIPDDPRGALRWSLSRLRGLVDEPRVKRIIADRDSVSLNRTGPISTSCRCAGR